MNIPIIFFALGIILFGLSLSFSDKLIKLLNKHALQKQWKVLYGMIIVFMLFYAFAIYLFVLGRQELFENFTALIFFSGAVFVLYIAMTSFSTMKKLIEATDSNKLLNKKNKELDLYTKMLSHDLKSPLRNIGSFATLLKAKMPDSLNIDGMKYLNLIIESVNDTSSLVEQLLDHSKIMELNPEDSFEIIDLEQVFNVIQTRLYTDIEKKNVKINMTNNFGTVYADKQKLGLLFQNLLDNAMKYNISDAPKIQVKFKKEYGKTIISIADNGIGIDKKYHTKIFNPFERLHSNDVYKGAGIGLANCKEIVEQMNGDIWLDSEPGFGSTFYVSLPTYAPEISAVAGSRISF